MRGPPGSVTNDLDALENMVQQAPVQQRASVAVSVDPPPLPPPNGDKSVLPGTALPIEPEAHVSSLRSTGPSPRQAQHDDASSSAKLSLLNPIKNVKSQRRGSLTSKPKLRSALAKGRPGLVMGQALTRLKTGSMSVNDLATMKMRESKDNVLQRDVQAKHITYYEFGVSSCFEGVDLLPGMVQVDAGVRHQDVPQNKFDAHVAAAKAASTARYASAGSTPLSIYNSDPKISEARKKRPCCWYHLSGVNYTALDILGKAYNLDPAVLEACKQVSSKPMVAWHPGEDSSGKAEPLNDHMLVVGHYIVQKQQPQSAPNSRSPTPLPGLDDEPNPEHDSVHDVLAYKFEQVSCILLPDHNTMISVDGGQKDWESIISLLHNSRNHVRQLHETPVLLFSMLDTMIDELFPLLDMYGDSLEGLEHLMMGCKEGPSHEHVRVSYKIRRRIHSLRRYAWDARQLIQELRQNQHGIIEKDSQKLLTSVEKNVESMVEVAEAYIEQCKGIESFYESFQEKTVSSTLYVLTITSVTILPIQTLSGIFGMNFNNMPELGVYSESIMTKYGYIFFWALVLLLTSCILCSMSRKGLLRQHRGALRKKGPALTFRGCAQLFGVTQNNPLSTQSTGGSSQA